VHKLYFATDTGKCGSLEFATLASLSSLPISRGTTFASVHPILQKNSDDRRGQNFRATLFFRKIQKNSSGGSLLQKIQSSMNDRAFSRNDHSFRRTKRTFLPSCSCCPTITKIPLADAQENAASRGHLKYSPGISSPPSHPGALGIPWARFLFGLSFCRNPTSRHPHWAFNTEKLL
jgi:hypothetical protein